MKKTFVLAMFLGCFFSAYTQSLTFKDLLFLRQQQSAKDFLTKKDFVFFDYGHNLERYSKNKDTGKEEKVMFSIFKERAYVSYTSPDTTYIRTIVKEIAKKYKLILKDESKFETYYRFGDLDSNIEIDIVKSPAVSGKITVGHL